MNRIARFGLRGAMLALCLAGTTIPMVMQAQDGGQAPAQNDAAQPGGRPDMGQMLDRQVEHLTRAVSLTPDQVAQVRPILQSQMNQMMALRQDTATPREERRGKMMKIRSDAQAKIRAVLTGDQQPKYDALLAQEQQRMERRREGNGGQGDQGAPPPPQQ